MRKSLIACLAILPLAVAAPPASAAAFHAGNCGWVPGHLYVVAVPYSTTARENPVTARVTCTLRESLGGSDLAGFTVEGTGVIAGRGAAPEAYDPDNVVCTNVDFLSTPDPDFHICSHTLMYEALWLADHWTEAVAGPTAIVDPYACPVLSSLSPGVPGVVDVEPGGDVAVAGARVWDCPPYED